jgi:hypothetical protein
VEEEHVTTSNEVMDGASPGGRGDRAEMDPGSPVMCRRI